uniref:microtubule-associated protein 10 n=1 Tax=Scatophagus argus TaxID=75038 RepID=UPI001ED84C5B|nr:microtubule-associated protein 10 [Scatophagus argus]
MSEQQNIDNVETLFSFEFLVECVRIEKESKVSDELALGVRLLDFPTLLIYQPQQSSGGINQQEHHGKYQQGEYAFNRGKSCFFKMNLNSLHAQLFNSPLYAMVLDVKEEIPRLVGTSLISLAKVMDRIRQDVTEHGASTPSSHGERGLVGICNLMGDKVGSMSLSYKLLSLGASLLPHIADSKCVKSVGVHREENTPESIISTELLPFECGNDCSPALDKSDVIPNKKPSNETNLLNEDKQDSIQTEHETRNQIHQTVKETENSSEDDLTVFCPPYLFYSNSAEEKRKSEGGGCNLLNLDSDATAFEDTFSEEEATEDKIEVTSSPIMNQRVQHDARVSRNQQTRGATPNVLREALQQLPLLNALLVELSQLNDQSPQQQPSIHPSLAWIYRPASTEPSAGHENTTPKAQTKSLQKIRQGPSPHLNHLHSPRNCSTPVCGPASIKVKDKLEEALVESKSSCTSPRKKLVYGTTKTFNLRLKQISSPRVKRHECMELIQNKTQSSIAKGKTKSSNKIMKSSKRKSALNQSSSLNENVETMVQNITVKSAPHETVTVKQDNLHGKVHAEQSRYPTRISEKPSHSERGLRVIHIPSVDGDKVAQNKDKNGHHSESDQSQSESDRHRDKIESSGSSRHSSPKSSFSDSSGDRNKEVDYADDFNSLEPSDAYSPDLGSSPEPSRAKTPWSSLHSDLCNTDSGSEGFQSRAILPVPIKAQSSPQRTLRATHIIRPRTHGSALSFSSNDGDKDRSVSLQTICSTKQKSESGRVERSSGADSFISSRGQSSKSTKNSDPVQGFSAESISSFEPQEAEELEDELGSLDFRKEYQHISKLVTSKLPGYTM